MANSSFPQSPDQLFGQLFRDVQLGRVFADSKTFVDCVPKLTPADLVALYETEKQKPDFDLSTFVHDYFVVPGKVASGPASADRSHGDPTPADRSHGDYVSDTTLSTADHISQLWDRLTRQADPPVEGSSRVPLPHPYIVPGGRFREIFYWDSYFTMLGLKESGRTDLIWHMLENFAYLINTFGFIPNGNRTYFLSRSQPPFFSLMVNLQAETEGPVVLIEHMGALQREYAFWMQGKDELTNDNPVRQRVVRLPDGSILNRYWDDTPTPRPEAYRQEVELMEEARQQDVVPEALYNHIRAACESGWDFSSRWFADPKTMVSIHTADIVPVDLNCLLYALETTVRNVFEQINWPDRVLLLEQQAAVRKGLIQSVFWNDETGFFHDYDFVAGQQTPVLTLAGVFPLFFKLATPEQAQRVHDRLRADFLQAGGWVTTLQQTGQQWDWPNGWAPLQWIVYQGLINYGFTETAHEGRRRWLALNDKVFRATGKMMEKYNVVDAALTTGGGEYPNQDGFGWTNGVYLRLLAEQA